MDDGPGGRTLPDDLPRSRTGRVPQWVIDEAAGRAGAGEPWRAAPPVPPERPAPRRRRRVRPDRGLRDDRATRWTPGAVLLVVTVVVAAWVVDSGRLPQVLAAVGVSRASAPAPLLGNPDGPSRGVGAADSPLGAPPQLAEEGTSFAFVATQADGRTPVAYDPCRPIHYVTRPDDAPGDGRELVSDALDRISAATGLQFVDDGATTEAPSRERALYQPVRYGDRWAPVLIAWSTPEEAPDLAGNVAGAAGSVAVERPGSPTAFVTGQVILDAPEFEESAGEPGGATVRRLVVLHEVGHLVGLRHVEDPTQLMYPEAQPTVTELGSGDLTGLAALGRGACVPAL